MGLGFESQPDHQREVFSNEDLFFLIRTTLLTVNLLRFLLRQYIRDHRKTLFQTLLMHFVVNESLKSTKLKVEFYWLQNFRYFDYKVSNIERWYHKLFGKQ